jgi:mannose-1-phosphate guanylyltransferase/mannose-6-phosphate isomerase
MPNAPLDITPVILAGGAGKRLRPLTGSGRSKPFLPLFRGYSLFQKTLQRCTHFAKPLVITHHDYASQAREQGGDVSILSEPFGRSTGPALIMAALHLAEENRPMLVMPSDHFMSDDQALYQAAAQALTTLKADDLVFLSVPAAKAQTRYGYIQTDAQHHVQRFIEKPDMETVRALLDQQHCFWNTGIFLTHPKHLLALIQQNAPATYKQAQACYAAMDEESKILAQSYKALPTQAIDYMLMEHVTSARVVALQTVWSDVGTWPALIKLFLKRRA